MCKKSNYPLKYCLDLQKIMAKKLECIKTENIESMVGNKAKN